MIDWKFIHKESVETLTDPEIIQKLCDEFKIRPTRGAGQNFLIDSGILGEMLAAAEIKKEDHVLEIGPGFGALTLKIAEVVKKVLAVELDKKIVQTLAALLPKNVENIMIQQNDALKLSNRKIVELLGKPDHYKVVSNLPYDITSAALRKFTEEEPRPYLIAVMVQKEVAERVCAKPGDMSILSVAVQYYGKPEIVSYVQRSAFWPQPEVDSAILRIKIRSGSEAYDLALGEKKKLFQIVRIGFSSRRKQLQNNLSAGLHITRSEALAVLQQINLTADVRAQELSVEQWIKLSKVLGSL